MLINAEIGQGMKKYYKYIVILDVFFLKINLI